MPVVLLLIAVALAGASPAAAQSFSFTREIPAGEAITVEVVTDNGQVDVVGGRPGRVRVEGTVRVKVGFTVPADAVTLARQIAAAPPITASETQVALGLPSGASARRAATVSYRVEVPASATVRVRTQSGAVTVADVAGASEVVTQSGAVDAARMGAIAIRTGSSGVQVREATHLTVTTRSGAVDAEGIGAHARIETASGQVELAMTAAASPGDVEVRTSSGAIRVRGARGVLSVDTRSGQVDVEGAPGETWRLTTGSAAVSVRLTRGAPFRVDAASRSGRVHVSPDTAVASSEHRALSSAPADAPLVRVRTGSGSIRIEPAR